MGMSHHDSMKAELAKIYMQRLVQTIVYVTLFMPVFAISAGCSVWIFKELAGK